MQGCSGNLSNCTFSFNCQVFLLYCNWSVVCICWTICSLHDVSLYHLSQGIYGTHVDNMGVIAWFTALIRPCKKNKKQNQIWPRLTILSYYTTFLMEQQLRFTQSKWNHSYNTLWIAVILPNSPLPWNSTQYCSGDYPPCWQLQHQQFHEEQEE